MMEMVQGDDEWQDQPPSSLVLFSDAVVSCGNCFLRSINSCASEGARFTA